MRLAAELMAAAETDWLDRWTAGPAEDQGSGLPARTKAPDLALADHTGRERKLSEFWAGQPALLMFWRHFGCGCVTSTSTARTSSAAGADDRCSADLTGTMA